MSSTRRASSRTCSATTDTNGHRPGLGARLRPLRRLPCGHRRPEAGVRAAHRHLRSRPAICKIRPQLATASSNGTHPASVTAPPSLHKGHDRRPHRQHPQFRDRRPRRPWHIDSCGPADPDHRRSYQVRNVAPAGRRATPCARFHARLAASSPAKRRRGVEESMLHRPYALPPNGPPWRSLPATIFNEQVRA